MTGGERRPAAREQAWARARLAWWLGPWSARSASPPDVERSRVDVNGGSYLYRPRRTPPRAAWLISPGMHLVGPDDERVDRFARVIAAGGAVVLSPRSPTFMGLRLAAGAIADLAAARAWFVRRPDTRGLPLRVASPSVGSLAAIHLAADPAAAVDRTVLIGGYVDAAGLTRSLAGGDPVARDPSSAPLVLATFIDQLPVAIADRARLLAGWDAVVRETWAVAAWQLPGSRAHLDVARRHAAAVAPADRELFLIGCGALPGAPALAAAALATGAHDHLELRPLLPRIGGELFAFHGPGDPVVPIDQLDALAAAAPRAHPYRLTGLDHGGPRPLPELLASLASGAVLAELRAFAALIAALTP